VFYPMEPSWKIAFHLPNSPTTTAIKLAWRWHPSKHCTDEDAVHP
jgi:hypothetical protein